MNENKMGIETLEKIAYVFIEKSEESKKAVELLRQEGFVVNTIPIVGLWEPKARIEGRLYEGIKDIKRGIKEYEARHQQI